MFRKALSLTVLAAACAAEPSPSPASEVDGGWIVVAIDGRPAPAGYSVEVKAGRIDGGRDGCNAWGWGSLETGAERGINSTLVGCPETNENRSYWAIARDDQARLTMQPDGMLAVEGAGRRVLARRVGLADKADWTVAAIDGAAIADDRPRFILAVEAGRIVRGWDGCAAWQWRDDATREPAIEQSSRAGGPGCQDDAERRSYWTIVRSPSARRSLRADGMLLLEAGGHHLLARPVAAGAEAPATPPEG